MQEDMEPDDRELSKQWRHWLDVNREALRAEAEYVDQLGVPGSNLPVGANYATGVEMHARLARRGKPLPISDGGLPRRFQPRMSIRQSLDAKPEPGKD